MMVKICGITNRADALAAIEGGASALGFNFYPGSPRYLDPDRAADLIASLPGPGWKVGVFVNETPERSAELVLRLGLDVAQVVGSLTPPGLRVWKTVHVGEAFSLAGLDRHDVEAVLLDTSTGESYGGTGRTF